MPIADISALVINANGHQRTNLAWVIGRLLRDFEYRADSQGNEQAHAKKTSGNILPFVSPKGAIGTVAYGLRPQGPGHEKASREAFRVTVFEVDPTRPPGRPIRDWIYYLSFAAIFVQMGVAAIPWALSMNYMPFVVTLSGATLTLLTSAVPQWGNEKYSSYRTGSWTVSITRGNGSRHVMLILGKDHGCPSGLDLEMMAARSNSAAPPPLTPVCMTVLAALSMMLLITVAGLREDTWCT